MADLIKDNVVNMQAILTGKAYSGINSVSSIEQKRPAGRYVCTECGDAQITFHNPVDKYKTNCPKCGTQMQLIPKPTTLQE